MSPLTPGTHTAACEWTRGALTSGDMERLTHAAIAQASSVSVALRVCNHRKLHIEAFVFRFIPQSNSAERGAAFLLGGTQPHGGPARARAGHDGALRLRRADPAAQRRLHEARSLAKPHELRQEKSETCRDTRTFTILPLCDL